MNEESDTRTHTQTTHHCMSVQFHKKRVMTGPSVMKNQSKGQRCKPQRRRNLHTNLSGLDFLLHHKLALQEFMGKQNFTKLELGIILMHASEYFNWSNSQNQQLIYSHSTNKFWLSLSIQANFHASFPLTLQVMSNDKLFLTFTISSRILAFKEPVITRPMAKPAASPVQQIHRECRTNNKTQWIPLQNSQWW